MITLTADELELNHIAELARQRMDAGVGHHGEQWRLGGRTAINFMMDKLSRAKFIQSRAAGVRGAEHVVIDAHWLENIAAAAALLSGDDSLISRREGEALYTLVKSARRLAAAPAPDHSAGVGGMVSGRKRRVFVDMDGVIVDFDAYKIANNMTGDEVKRTPGAYLAMPAIPGAVEAVRSVIGMGFDVWIATKPPTGVPYAYSDKAAWIMEHLPELKRKIIITHDKGLLGDAQDFLCDDRPHKANCERFAGSLLRFVDGYHWTQALDDLRAALAQPADADAEGAK